ncbi:BofC C-terminal domain-containing protein [Gracilibacillus sp. JCM 18860]|uniref:BofC C-terminal domain-containing protein n=1 Tax=Gracilibacillus sp. JCM 18860 TaxID=1306159 RepID=UPI0006CFE46A
MSKLWLSLNVLVLVMIGCYFIFERNDPMEEMETSPVVAKEPHTIELKLEKKYIDGKTEVEETTTKISSMEDFWSQYQQWTLVEQKQGYIHFKQDVDDISPYLKTYGYFGIDDGGVLTIFEGIPVHEEVIQSFYHIDTNELESHLLEDLEDGIKIKTKEDYQQVIETFRTYQISEPVNS